MAQDTRNTSDVQAVGYTTAQIDTLLASFEAGDIITKAAVDAMLDYYADIHDHDHDVDDYATKDTFGNLAGDQTSVTTGENTQVANLNSIPVDPGTNSTITASKHNEIRNAVNSLRGHVHVWDDN
jgi:hypothetical protein